MDDVMLASFLDEMTKIAENAVTSPAGATALGKPASVSSGMSSSTSMSGTLKSPTKPTNYSVVHNSTPVAATGTANLSKSIPPPPVRA